LENRNYRPKHRFQAEDKHHAEAEIDDFRAEEHLVMSFSAFGQALYLLRCTATGLISASI
jgi:hypothetical protein